jgi:AcrR family transcriptional regulator
MIDGQVARGERTRTAMIDGRVARGERTRTAVLDAAVALATQAGLHGLTLGQLADQLGVSKSGLFAHWRSKEELQLAAVEHARQQWIEHVVSPGLRAPRGVRRLLSVHQARLDFYEANVLPGGCFFANTHFEYDCRVGPVHDRLTEIFDEWQQLLERLATEAVTLGELPEGTDVAQLVFEINAAGAGAIYQSRKLLPATVYVQARRVVLDRLRSLCTDPTLLPEA